eukprot:15358077-Ditylum_brightwellii.AAC.1
MGKSGVICESTKQKVNSQKSTEAELVAVDNKIVKIMWTKQFIEHQGFKFYITDLISRKEVEIAYCPTKDMLADFMSKPTTGPVFKKLIFPLASRSVLASRKL